VSPHASPELRFGVHPPGAKGATDPPVNPAEYWHRHPALSTERLTDPETAGHLPTGFSHGGARRLDRTRSERRRRRNGPCVPSLPIVAASAQAFGKQGSLQNIDARR
jgi:hypothetical protein